MPAVLSPARSTWRTLARGSTRTPCPATRARQHRSRSSEKARIRASQPRSCLKISCLMSMHVEVT